MPYVLGVNPSRSKGTTMMSRRADPEGVYAAIEQGAACSPKDGDLFVNERSALAQEMAKEICLGCPVRELCLEVNYFQPGVVIGAMTWKERVAPLNRTTGQILDGLPAGVAGWVLADRRTVDPRHNELQLGLMPAQAGNLARAVQQSRLAGMDLPLTG